MGVAVLFFTTACLSLLRGHIPSGLVGLAISYGRPPLVSFVVARDRDEIVCACAALHRCVLRLRYEIRMYPYII